MLQLFSWNHKAEVGLRALCAFKSKVNVVVIPGAQYQKKYVLKYDKKSYANIVTICTYLENAASRNVLQYYEIIGCNATFFLHKYKG